MRLANLRAAVFGLAAWAVFALPAAAQFSAPAGGETGGETAAFPQSAGTAFAPSTDQVVNSGLGVRLLFVGRNENGKALTISAEVQNLSEEPAFIALVGPPPAAIDTNGVTYTLANLAGLANCESMLTAHISRCFANTSGYLPGEAFSLLQPQASAIVALTFESEQASTSGFLSVTLSIALGTGTRPASSSDRATALENVAISFPLVALDK